MTKVAAAILAVVLVVGAFTVFRFLSAGPGTSDQSVVFEVPPGKSFHQIAEQLEKQGLVSSALFMRVLARLTRQANVVKAGEYALNKGMGPNEILATLASGKSIQYPVTFPEGTNIYEMAQILESKKFYSAIDFLRACHDKAVIHELLGVDVSSLEGYLFPETYNITKFTPLHDLLAAMVQNFKNAYAESEVATKKHPLLTRHEMVILASMVEKESGAPEDRPLVASVFYNRLGKSMKLQSDPTIIYGIWDETGAYKNNITKEDLLRPTRYNTYTVAKLPFGPICNPGRESLMAVMKPTHSDYLYFVSHNDGTTGFSRTLDEHNQNVRTFQLDPAAREGKSWRDLKKRVENQ